MVEHRGDHQPSVLCDGAVAGVGKHVEVRRREPADELVCVDRGHQDVAVAVEDEHGGGDRREVVRRERYPASDGNELCTQDRERERDGGVAVGRALLEPREVGLRGGASAAIASMLLCAWPVDAPTPR